eukprot:SM000232S07920  [mRNA]  locus=s232:60383:61109:- [translate_table: standard]
MVGRGQSFDIVDPKLQGQFQAEDVDYVLTAALKCVDFNAVKRPKMAQVIRMLETDDLVARVSPADLFSVDSIILAVSVDCLSYGVRILEEQSPLIPQGDSSFSSLRSGSPNTVRSASPGSRSGVSPRSASPRGQPISPTAASDRGNRIAKQAMSMSCRTK